MFFDELDNIPEIAHRVSCAIFVVPRSHFAPDRINQLFPRSLLLGPDEDKTTTLISVENLRNFIAQTNNISTSEQFLVIAPADAMNEAAQNAFLKTFEEPGKNYHFALFTDEPSKLLPTIRSRAQIFYQRIQNSINQAPQADPEIMELAKILITTDVLDLPSIANQLTTAKPKPREQALAVVSTAIEILYKSYFKTNNEKFLTKLPNLLKLHDNLSNNGHIKLHVVADLL